MVQRETFRQLRAAMNFCQDVQAGREFGFSDAWKRDFPKGPPENNDLRAFFSERRQGPGIWKWEHYFEIYSRHLEKFRGKSVRLVEIGVYSGGSLEMWKEYLGPKAEIIGVDIEPTCKHYERPGVQIYIGDQGDRSFWANFKKSVSGIDIVIDDGGHLPSQQITTMEEVLPVMNPGGVYICEDVHGSYNQFSDQVYGLAASLNTADQMQADFQNPERRLAAPTTALQGLVNSVSFYPFVIAIELRQRRLDEFVAPKRGTQWEPFIS